VLTLAHIINPVKVSINSDLFVAQPITFESMKRAVRWVELEKIISVKLLATQYPEDREIIPEYFYTTSDLNRSVLDEGKFVTPRKLPLINDIFGKLTDVDADYFIYTNVDIGLMPHFYLSIGKYLNDGYDALVINRRTVQEQYDSINDLPNIYAEIGEIHKGYDCFVFSKRILSKLELGKIAIGAPGVGIALFVNLYCLSKQFLLLDDHHLTFHIGNDKEWNNEKFADYRDYNKKQLEAIYHTLRNKDYPLEAALSYHKSTLVKNKFLKAPDRSPLRTVIKKFIN